ncbi:DUF2380 domain-containing protein [Pseudorhizobium sp. NPDC055634]
MAETSQPPKCRPFGRSAASGLAVSLAVLAAGALPDPAIAAEPVSLAVAGFDFVDTSGEARDQSADHDRRLAALERTISGELSAVPEVKAVAMDCVGACSVRKAGVEALSGRAVEAGATHLLIGEVRKMSTLVGGVKFAVIDLATNRATCDRFLSYRGDTDEAWSRAAAFTVQVVVRDCLP